MRPANRGPLAEIPPYPLGKCAISLFIFTDPNVASTKELFKFLRGCQSGVWFSWGQEKIADSFMKAKKQKTQTQEILVDLLKINQQNKSKQTTPGPEADSVSGAELLCQRFGPRGSLAC